MLISEFSALYLYPNFFLWTERKHLEKLQDWKHLTHFLLPILAAIISIVTIKYGKPDFILAKS